ncbi:dihydroneopterin aldolase [Thioclava sp. SK-1]|uniref:disulfide bond formation protein B n=1 Tax=Thioclava sp. SK-1 TaxID=1889770 RepID=UPI0008241B45|nr:disulfide bond formation protein B [Thioclava sp. SK-1]OCX67058.1 dihydroneopterin aldolase [Thioclava sp. SK-1]
MPSQRLVLLAAGGSAALLAAALIFQALGYAPCHLCLLQRWPHVAAVAIGLVIWGLRLPMVTALLGAAATATTAVLGLYHSLVERHLIEGPSTCTSGGIGQQSVDDLMAQIQGAPLVQCDAISWQMLGLTMANLNAIFSIGLCGLWITAWLRAR